MDSEFSFILRPSGFKAIDQLLATEAFDYSRYEDLFLSAMREAFSFHYEDSEAFRGVAKLSNFKLEDLRRFSDIERIPWMFVQNFKERELLSVPRTEVVKIFTSSGTGGLKTQLFLDAISYNRIQVAAYAVYKAAGAVDQKASACNYLLFSYDYEKAKNLGTAWTDAMIEKMVPAKNSVSLICEREGAFQFDLELAVSSYEKFVESGLPLRLLGFPAFIYQTLLEVQKRGLPGLSMEQAQASWVLTGGGWKNHSGEIIGKKKFAEFTNAVSGIPEQNVRDLFGMSEHGVGYIDCEYGRLHIPVYAHALTRDPFTLERLPDGEPGMLQLFSPILKSYPSISLLTTDEVVIEKDRCRCGRPGRGFQYRGRLGTKPMESCAIRALEYLK
jgi:phenylacetate-coenzyme A ligase PaaK-like adenylate-forming protein